MVKLSGKSMIQRVYENCHKAPSPLIQSSNFEDRQKTPFLDINCETYVLTDHDKIEEHVLSFGGKVLRVDDLVNSGTERIGKALERYFPHDDIQIIVNVQGDEPLLKGEDIHKLIQFHLHSPFDVCTMVKEMNGAHDDFLNPNRVKVAYSSETGECLYFSRAPIPYVRNRQKEEKWYLHVGIYSYTTMSLNKYFTGIEGHLEKTENLEQLRFREMGMKIGGLLIDQELMSVDSPEDVAKVEGVLNVQETN